MTLLMKLESARVLVTGAGGFIGSRLTARLVRNGASVVCQVLPSENRSRLAPVSAQVEMQQADLRDPDATQQMVKNAAPEVVFHLAAAGVTEPFLPLEDALRVNLYGTICLLRAVEGTARVVLARTSGERSNLNPYAASKSAAWAVAQMLHRAQGWPIVALMLYQVYGPGQSERALVPSAIRAGLRGGDFPMTHGAQVRDWVYVDDVLNAFLAAASTPHADGHTLQIGTGRGTSLRDVVARIWAMTGASGQVQAGALPARPGEVAAQVADPKLAARLLGWRAKVALEEGLRRTISDVTESGAEPITTH
jgi:UDP-glucose 4-epimerase